MGLCGCECVLSLSRKILMCVFRYFSCKPLYLFPAQDFLQLPFPLFINYSSPLSKTKVKADNPLCCGKIFFIIFSQLSVCGSLGICDSVKHRLCTVYYCSIYLLKIYMLVDLHSSNLSCSGVICILFGSIDFYPISCRLP